MARNYKRLGDLVLSLDLISQEDLNRALEIQKSTKKRLGKVLTEYDFISEGQLIEALRLQLGVEFIDLSKASLSSELVNIVPKNIAKRHGVVPIKANRDEVYLAMSDPLNFLAIEEVKNVSRRRVVPMIAIADNIERAITNLYGNESAVRAIEEMRRVGIAGDTKAENDTMSSSNLTDDVQAAPTIRLVNSIIERAVTERASDIHLEAHEEQMVVRIRVDGVLRTMLTVPSDLQNSVISRLKVMGSLNISERKIPQDGRANVVVKTRDIDMRISTLPTAWGEKMVIRLLDKSTQMFNKQGIGLTGQLLERYDRMLRATSGVILITGPTGSGKSSTMLTMIKVLSKETVNVVTLEDPIEYNIDGVNQCQINEKVGMTFAGGLRSILRQDPDVISVGEIRDGETASIAMRAAITGHLVLSTIHTNDSISTLDRLVDIGVEPFLIGSAIKGVISQRLVRKICPACRTAYEPTEDEMELVGIKNRPGMKFYKGVGCPACAHTGYAGRTGVFEIFLVEPSMRRLIVERRPYADLYEEAVKTGFRSLSEHCRDLVLEGQTTVEEAARTIYSTLEN